MIHRSPMYVTQPKMIYSKMYVLIDFDTLAQKQVLFNKSWSILIALIVRDKLEQFFKQVMDQMGLSFWAKFHLNQCWCLSYCVKMSSKLLLIWMQWVQMYSDTLSHLMTLISFAFSAICQNNINFSFWVYRNRKYKNWSFPNWIYAPNTWCWCEEIIGSSVQQQ